MYWRYLLQPRSKASKYCFALFDAVTKECFISLLRTACLLPVAVCLCLTAACLPTCLLGTPQPCASDRHQRGGSLMPSVIPLLWNSGLTRITAVPTWDCLLYLNISIFPYSVARKCCRMLQNFSFLSISPFSRHFACLAACRYLPHECEVPEKCSSERFFVPNGLLRQATVELGISVVI